MSSWDNLSDEELMAIANGQAAGAKQPRRRTAYQDLQDELGGDMGQLYGVAPAISSRTQMASAPPSAPMGQAQQPSFDDLSDEELMAIANQGHQEADTQSNPLQAAFDAKKGNAGGAARAIVYGLSGGQIPFGNVITSGIGAGIAKLASPISGDTRTLAELYDQAQADTKATQEANPTATTIGNVLGMATTLPAAFSKPVQGAGLIATPAKGLKSASDFATKLVSATPFKGGGIGSAIGNNLARAAGGAATAAPIGGLYSAGDADAGQRGDAFLKGAITSGAIGAVLPVALPAVGAGLSALNTKTIVPNSNEIKQLSSAAYKKADELGGIFKPEFTNNFLTQARKNLLSGDDIIDAMKSNKPLSDAYNDLKAFENQPMTLQRAQALDEQLGNMVDATKDSLGNVNKVGNKIKDVQSSFRKLIEDADESLIIGEKGGFQSLKEARNLWSTQRRLADIERVIENADLYSVPATAIKTGFRQLYKNAKASGYSAEEAKALKRAAETGAFTDLLATFGSRLGALAGGAAGGPAGAILGYGTSAASRAGATSSQMARANEAAKTVAQRSGLVKTEQRIPIDKLQKAFLTKKAEKAIKKEPLKVTVRPSNKDKK